MNCHQTSAMKNCTTDNVPRFRIVAPCLATWLMLAGVLAVGVSGARGEPAASGRASADVEPLAELTTSETEDEFPAVGFDAAGRLWVAWVSYDGQQDQVLACTKEGTGWSKPLHVSSGLGDHWRPAIGSDGQGRLWVTWSQNQDKNWDVWGRYIEGDEISPCIQLTKNEGNDFAQKLAADNQGRLWMAWQAVVDGNYEILLAQVTPTGLEELQNVSQHSAGDWEPALAADRTGGLLVGWDSYRGGSYDILVRGFRSGKLGPIVAVARSPEYEAHAALAVDHQNRLWVAWDNGGPHWGRHGESRIRLHGRRSVGLRCLKDGQLLAPAEALSTILTGEFEAFCELPELIVDGDGRLWLFVRHLRNLTPPGTRRNGRPYQSRGIWNPYALCYAAGRWSAPLMLPSSNGRNDMRLSACLDADGQVYAAWAEDGRKPTRAEEPVNHNVYVGSLRLPAEAAGGPNVAPASEAATTMPAEATPQPTPSRYTVTVNNTTYQLLYGDTHRHTDISRCGMNFDGSLMDTYRYAIDVAGLDFLGISDHDQDLLRHRYDKKQSPLLGYAWWRSQKYCDLFYIEDEFIPIYGYEHGGSYKARGGHKNVMYSERGMPCYEEDAPDVLFHLLQGKDAVAIPHQLADGGSRTDWDRWNRDFERVAEIFQTRGSYEFFGAPREAKIRTQGHYLWDFLGRGGRIGVIASSDHGLVHGAYAGVYAERMTRQSILEALRNRRSFGATDTIAVDLRLGEHLLGEEVTVERRPSFDLVVRGTAPIKQVQIVKEGKFVYTNNPGKPTCQLTYTDMTLAPGDSAYYYARVEQENGEWAWSSAIWVEHR